MQDVLSKRPLRGHELRKVVTSLGKSRSDDAADLPSEFASDELIFEGLDADIVNAIAALNTPSTHDLLSGFIDPDSGDLALTRGFRYDEALIEALADLAQHRPRVAKVAGVLPPRSAETQSGRAIEGHGLGRNLRSPCRQPESSE